MQGYITVTDFAKHFSVSRQFVWNLIKTKKIKAIKIGALYKIPISEINRVEKGEH